MRDDDLTMERHPFLEARDPRLSRPMTAGPLSTLDWRQTLGGAFILAGIAGVMVAWFGISGTLDPGKQMPYLASGGIGGAALIAIGVTLFLSFEHARDRAALADVLDRLDRLEQRLDAEARPEAGNGAPPRRPARSSRR